MSIFARFGLPEVVMTDNCPQFISEQFKTFCKSNAIRYARVAPYHPTFVAQTVKLNVSRNHSKLALEPWTKTKKRTQSKICNNMCFRIGGIHLIRQQGCHQLNC